MDKLLLARVCAAFLVDGSIAVLFGLLLAGRWLHSAVAPPGGAAASGELLFGRDGVKTCAGLLCLGSCWQLILLAISFGGESSARAVMAILPEVSRTHTGGVLVASSALAGLLSGTTWLAAGGLQRVLWWALALCFLGLHGAVGHAAVDGVFSWAEGLQWAHLLGMAMWSGGVLVSGLMVVPRMGGGSIAASKVRPYMELLSTVSTWCVAVVLVTGVMKGYRVTGGVALLRSSDWGQVLLVKTFAVTMTLFLGARNRWLLGSAAEWDESLVRRVTKTLRAESVCMAVVLLLSAWLANSPLPME